MTGKSFISTLWIAMIALVFGLWNTSPAWAGVPDSSIRIATGCSQLDIQDAPLPNVAQALSQESGIQIQLPASLLAEFISARLYAKDCSSAVLLVLQEFSMMKFWDDEGGLVAVHLLNRKQAWVPEAASPEGSVSLIAARVESDESPGLMAEVLDKDQIQILMAVGRGTTPPSEVLNNPAFTPFLHQVGLRESEDWKDKKKLKILHKQALRAWVQKRKALSSE